MYLFLLLCFLYVNIVNINMNVKIFAYFCCFLACIAIVDIYADTQNFTTKEFESVVIKMREESGKNLLKVGFDIDETIIYDNEIQNYLEKNCDGDWYECIKQEGYWLYFNTEGMDNVIVKQNVKQLVLLHASLGDAIYFITARPETKNTIKQFIFDNFNIKYANLLFVGNSDKSDVIKDLNLDLYYGDADSDISSAKNGGAKSVRVLRTDECYYHDSGYTLGKNEEDYLMIDSKY